MNIADWFLEKMGFSEEEGDEEFEVYSEETNIVYKKVKKIEDAREVINCYKAGAVCVAHFVGNEKDNELVVNYLNGAIYALEGKVEWAGRNVQVICKNEVVRRHFNGENY